MNRTDVTYGHSVSSYATAEEASFVMFTPPYKAYNQLVSFTSEANTPYMGVTTGHSACRVRNALFVYINF